MCWGLTTDWVDVATGGEKLVTVCWGPTTDWVDEATGGEKPVTVCWGPTTDWVDGAAVTKTNTGGVTLETCWAATEE